MYGLATWEKLWIHFAFACVACSPPSSQGCKLVHLWSGANLPSRQPPNRRLPTEPICWPVLLSVPDLGWQCQVRAPQHSLGQEESPTSLALPVAPDWLP